MLGPRRNSLVFCFFSWYISRIIRTDFHRFAYNEIPVDSSRAILLLSNHFSWWDGFLLFHLNKICFRKNFHVMITEENYQKVWFLKYLGSFAVRKNSKSIIETLEYAGRLLDNPDNLVLVFPQGQLHSGHTDEIQFQKGLMNLVNASGRQFQFVFSAILTDYFEHRKPSVTCYLKSWEAEQFTSLQLIKAAYNKHYRQALDEQRQISV